MANAKRLGEAVADELASLGMGEGEFLVELREREVGPTGADEATFLIRPNAGLPFAPIADTASGGELSRVALALAAVAGGETLVFDEIDAGIGGVTAHAVAATLQRLAERAQVLTITHLPQIASVADATSASRRSRATRLTRASRSSTTSSGARRSSAWPAAPSSSRRCGGRGRGKPRPRSASPYGVRPSCLLR